MSNEDDDYDELDDLLAEGAIVQREVQIVAIFANGNGDVVIKEFVPAFPSRCETSIVIGRNNVADAIALMRRAAGIGDDHSETEPKDRTAAERQRRRRQRLRDAERDTHRDSQTEEPELSLVAAE